MTLFRKFSVAAVSALLLAGSLGEASAMPLPVGPTVPAASSDVTNVQYYRHYGGRPGWHGDRGGWGRPGWHGGYRGYRGYRDGYRYHNGYWFPLAAFGAGALIGGAIASQPRYVEPAPVYSGGGINPRHYQWCSERYRSYDSYSNTFQPNNGPRRTCLSPYY
ncbi:BA14K-like protein [Neorhizobium alkalisoli]|uniref:Lectin-like protein BA14k n=2 Tax=Neorhizobium alkalisoli TaxID=528178 RepID=A0A561R3Q9_9HYPH|nr:BA14K family protein [Neorhizobium alkalisoli]TWF57250.1 BA14K-like protein [Neorhizobium alkalisoli]